MITTILYNTKFNTWTPWTPWTPPHSIKKYFKNDDHERGQCTKVLLKKNICLLE
jgi:hypothetical protein